MADKKMRAEIAELHETISALRAEIALLRAEQAMHYCAPIGWYPAPPPLPWPGYQITCEMPFNISTALPLPGAAQVAGTYTPTAPN